MRTTCSQCQVMAEQQADAWLRQQQCRPPGSQCQVVQQEMKLEKLLPCVLLCLVCGE
jgi:hypothetical protein